MGCIEIIYFEANNRLKGALNNNIGCVEKNNRKILRLNL